MKKLIIIFFVLLSASFIMPQPENASNFHIKRIKYYQDFLNFAGKNNTKMDVFVQVPFKAIQFVKTSKGLQGGYSITVSVYDEDKEKLIIEKLWNEKIKISSFDEARDKDNYNISHRSFKLKPGKYFIKTVLTDKDSKKNFPSENMFIIKDFSKKPSVSDIMLVSKHTDVNGKDKIVPNISRNVSTVKHGMEIYYEIYSDSTLKTPVNINYVITNKEKDVLYSINEKTQLKPGVNKVFYTIKDTSFVMGKYLLTVVVKDENGDALTASTKPFYSRMIGLPSSITDIDKAISQLRYIANPNELDYIEEGKNENQKIKRFMEFWKKKDPSPGNPENEVFEEYYTRVAYANENFSNYMEGWLSDRGMVFIILGAPDNVERHPFDYDSKPYEVWQYYDINRSFVFVDRTGFGDYRLTTPFYGDDLRYRY